MLRIVLKIVVCLLLAGGSLFWALSSMKAILSYRPVLDLTPPPPGEALGGNPDGRVVFVLIDGLRVDTAADSAVMPVLASLRQQGASAIMHSRPPSLSTPSYGVLLTGAWAELSGGMAFNPEDTHDIPPISQDTIFKAAQRAGLKTAASAYVYFQGLLGDSADISFYTEGDEDAADREVLAKAIPWIESGDYSLVLIHIDQLDHAGHHEGGGVSAGWDAAAARADALLAEIVARLDLSRDTLLVLSDHGHLDIGGHGGGEAVATTEPFVLIGAHVRPGQYADIQEVDVAPTVAAILGTNLPASAQGEARLEMLQLNPQAAAALPGLERSQQLQLVEMYSQAIGYPSAGFALEGSKTVSNSQLLLSQAQDARKAAERLPRAVLAAVLWAALLFLIRPWRWIGWRVWVGAVLAFGLFYMRIALDPSRTFSYSTLGGASDLILLGASGALPALLLVGLLFSTRPGWRAWQRHKAAEAALDMGLATGWLILLPLLAEFVWDGLLPTWTLPDFSLHYFFVLSAIQIVMTLAFTPLLAGTAALLVRKSV
jgi:hypothetical protein